MAIWKELSIGEWKILHTPLQPEKLREHYETCDKDGKPVKFARMLKDGTIIKDGVRNVYVDRKGNVISSSELYRLVKGKPLAKAKLTKEVLSYKEVDLKKARDLVVVEKIHICINNRLRDYLIKRGKALEFVFTNGGYKYYIANIYPYEDFLVMALGYGSITALAQQVIVEREQNKKVEVDDVERFNPEMLVIKQR